VDRAARRVAAEKKKEKKDAEKGRAREQMRARDALERRRRRQERDGLPREPSPETPDDDDDEDDDMAARLGLSPDLRLGQGSPSQPPSGLAPSVSGAGTSRSGSEERGQAEGVLDPLDEVVEVTPGSQTDPPVPQEQSPMPVAHEVGSPAIATTPGRAAPLAPRAPEVEATPESAAGLPLAASARAEGRGPRGLPAGTIGPSPEWVSTRGYLCFGSFSVCPDPALSLPFSKRRQGSAGLAPRKALKTVLASMASAAACHAGWLASAQDALERGAQATRVAMGQASQADPSIGAAIVPGEAADVAAAPSPPDVLPVPAPAPTEAVAVLPVEPPVAADAGMAEVPLLEVVSDLPSLDHKERAATVAEVGDWRPASLAEGRHSTSSAMVPDASTAGDPDALEEGRAEPRPVLGSGDLIPTWRNPNEWCGQALRFWTCGASKPLFVLDDEREEQSREELHEYAEAAMGSLRSTMEILSRDVPRVLQVRILGVPLA
jgi:hypothetical protein